MAASRMESRNHHFGIMSVCHKQLLRHNRKRQMAYICLPVLYLPLNSLERLSRVPSMSALSKNPVKRSCMACVLFSNRVDLSTAYQRIRGSDLMFACPALLSQAAQKYALNSQHGHLELKILNASGKYHMFLSLAKSTYPRCYVIR